MTDSSGSSFLQRPGTHTGWWAVGLAVVFAVMFMIDTMVFMRLPGDAPGRQTWLPYYGVVMMLCGLAAGVVGVIAVIRKHERSWLIWLTILDGAFVLFFILGELLGPH